MRPATCLLALLILVGAAAATRAADDKDQASTVLTTKEGIHFQLPPDWPVERRGGGVGPIPVEEYLGRKFSALESRLQLLERQVGALDVRLRVLEETVKKESLKSVERRPQ